MRHNIMKGSLNCLLRGLLTLGITALPYSLVLAGEKEDMEAMQDVMNQQTMDKPFNAGDQTALDAYLLEALKKGHPPPQKKPPMNWQPGWTCSNLQYSYHEYRNCLHYHRYYGHYYEY